MTWYHITYILRLKLLILPAGFSTMQILWSLEILSGRSSTKNAMYATMACVSTLGPEGRGG